MLEYMLAIAEEKSITKAAERVHISQSALSQNLLRLESSLETALFIRGENRCIPTAVGELYLEAARQMLDIKNDAYRSIKALSLDDEKQVDLSICHQVSLLYGDKILKTIKEGFPDTQLNFFRMDSSKAKEHIKQGTIDLAIMSRPFTDKKLAADEAFLYRDELVLAVPAHMAWEGDRLDLEKISLSSLIIPIKESNLGKLLAPFISKYLIDTETCYQAGDSTGLLLLLKNGYGAAFIPRRVAEAEMKDDIRIYSADPPLYYDIFYAMSPHYKDLQTASDMLRIIRGIVA